MVGLFWLLSFFKYEGIQVASSAVLVAASLSVLTSFIAYLVLDRDCNGWGYFIFGTIFCLHPFTTDIFSFPDVTLAIYLCYFVGAFAVFCFYESTSWRLCLFAGLALILALSIYQLVVSIAFAMLSFGFVFALLRYSGRPPNSELFRWLRVAALLCASVIGYFIANKIVLLLTGAVPEARAKIIGLADIPTRLVMLPSALRTAFAPSQNLIPAFVAGLQLLLLIVGVTVSTVQIYRRQGLFWAALGSVCFIVCVLVALAPALAGTGVWIIPRTVASVSVVIAGTVTLAWLCLKQQAPGIFGSALALLLLGYVATDNRILFDQRRVNLWDAQQANRLVGRLEMLPNFPDMKELVIVDSKVGYDAVLPTASRDLTLSGFSVPYTAFFNKNAVVEQATGYRLSLPTTESRRIATEYCKHAELWPSRRSIAIIGTVAVACFTAS
jgi:hypothetical protein